MSRELTNNHSSLTFKTAFLCQRSTIQTLTPEMQWISKCQPAVRHSIMCALRMPLAPTIRVAQEGYVSLNTALQIPGLSLVLSEGYGVEGPVDWARFCSTIVRSTPTLFPPMVNIPISLPFPYERGYDVFNDNSHEEESTKTPSGRFSKAPILFRRIWGYVRRFVLSKIKCLFLEISILQTE